MDILHLHSIRTGCWIDSCWNWQSNSSLPDEWHLDISLRHKIVTCSKRKLLIQDQQTSHRNTITQIILKQLFMSLKRAYQ
nr:MAG TPA: hypothetical protein [Caudoviricetes sp.]